MTLQFQIRREDAVACTLAFYATSPTYLKTRARLRWAGPVLMAVLEMMLWRENGFQWPYTLFFGAIAVGWLLVYPRRFDAIVRKYAEKTVAEPAYARMLGPCTLALTPEGLQSVSPMGASTFAWDAVTDVRLTSDYLHILLGALGYPIQIADIGREAAEQAFALVNEHRSRRSGV